MPHPAPYSPARARTVYLLSCPCPIPLVRTRAGYPVPYTKPCFPGQNQDRVHPTPALSSHPEPRQGNSPPLPRPHPEHALNRIRLGWYASWCHAGGLSCCRFEVIERNGNHFSAVMGSGVLNFPTGWIRVMVRTVYTTPSHLSFGLFTHNEIQPVTEIRPQGDYLRCVTNYYF